MATALGMGVKGGHVSWVGPLAHGRLVPDPIAWEVVRCGGRSWGFGKQEVKFHTEALPLTGHVVEQSLNLTELNVLYLELTVLGLIILNV